MVVPTGLSPEEEAVSRHRFARLSHRGSRSIDFKEIADTLLSLVPCRSPLWGLLLLLLACGGNKLASTPSPGEQIDVFTQLPRAKNDILWVIDSSGSMAREQAQLATSFPKFFAHLQSSNVDYRIGVITADVITNPAQAGALQGMPAVVVGNSSDPRVLDTVDPQGSFGANVQVGTNGSARDEAFESALLALQSLELQASAAEDAGQAVLFLRPDAALFLIFVGDGSEFSPESDLAGVQYYWREFLQAKGIGNDALVSVAAIAGDLPNGCTPVGCGGTDAGPNTLQSAISAAPGVRYFELAELANGVFGSICDCNFDSTLDALGLQALGLTHKFRLSRSADPTQIAVEVDDPCGTPDPTNTLICDRLAATCAGGVGAQCTSGCAALGLACTVPPLVASDGGIGTEGWSYTPGDNSITFTGGTLPGPGSQIRVTYNVRGGGQ